MLSAHRFFVFLRQRLAIFMLFLVFFTVPVMAQNSQRVALLIGNATYSTAPLRNPPNDIREMQAALSAVGFKVEVVLNANQNQMKRAVRDFGNLAQGVDIAFLYYSGHGTQANGENYLLPIGASIDKEADYEVEAVSANTLMRQISGARPKAAIVVLDACRDNPYASVTRSTSKGLGRMDAPTGSMIAFATAPNNTASDNGDYARVLARQLQTPGLELFEVFRNTTAEVRRISGGKQEPRISEVSITERIYLAGEGTARPQTPVQVASVVPEPVQQPAAPVTPAARSSILQSLQLQLPGSNIKDCAACPELVIVPAGSFLMGSSAAEQGLANAASFGVNVTRAENPQHHVNVRGFAAGRYAVTKGEFSAFVRAKNYQTEAELGDGCVRWTGIEWIKDKEKNWRNPGFDQADDHPVVCVSWNDAQAYTQWLGQISGKNYRLLSEAEREYAARSGTQTAFWWGDGITTSQANYHGNYSYNGSPKGEYRRATVPVNSFKANPYGLYNVHGNVLEWVQDVWHDNYMGAPTDGSAWMAGGDKASRVIRGGSWFSNPGHARAAFRNSGTLAVRNSNTGFRIARNL